MNTKRKTLSERLWRYRYFLLIYLALLIVSQTFRFRSGKFANPTAGQSVLTVNAVDGDRIADSPVQIAYWDLQPSHGRATSTILLVHGSPMFTFDLEPLARKLSEEYRVVAPDLPGFGRSTRKIPDYSMKAHGLYLKQIIDALHLDRIHVVAYSQGGGAALYLFEDEPDPIQSLTLVSSIGVQEFELLGHYHLNHALHGVQLAFFWMTQNLIPHMGFFDDMVLNMAYARNFYDSDQRPLRSFLAKWQKPMLIIHGADDPLVPLAAAEEHFRIVPQSELTLVDGGHLLVFHDAPEVASDILAFIDRCEAGLATTRDHADPERVARAERGYDAASAHKATGIALVLLIVLVALSTLVSEDLACIGAGLLVTQGIIGYFPAALASFLGIFFGDILLYLAGRYIGRPALQHRPLKWFVREDALHESAKWFSEKGPIVILMSRFVPGSRLPTYFAAGMLRTQFWKYVLYFFVAGAIWAPLLVWLSVVIGRELIEIFEAYRFYTISTLLLAALALWLVIELIVPLFTFRGRRLLVGTWRRRSRWEFWPLWIFYPPVFIYICFLALKHRSATLFTACNPAIPASGFIGESKSAILKGLSSAGQHLAHSRLIEPMSDPAQGVQAVHAFLRDERLSLPVVLKPDVGQRGLGVAVLRSDDEVRAYFSKPRGATIVQEYVSGHEFGVFYYRYPDQPHGHIFSITEKRFPKVVGDGRSDIERLILKDQRAVCLAHLYMKANGSRLSSIPAQGENIQLVEIGTHCRGSIFHDGIRVKTQIMENTIDAISRSFDGFYFGRYDIRTASVEAFQQGRDFKIIELNGVTAEATHIYSPGSSIFAAYRSLMTQWRIAFEIGAINRKRGVKPIAFADLVRALLHYEPAAEAK